MGFPERYAVAAESAGRDCYHCLLGGIQDSHQQVRRKVSEAVADEGGAEETG
jgi:hypothetical protein